MKKKKICFIAQFPPPMHGLSKAVETLYNSNLSDEFDFEKIDIKKNKEFFKNLIRIWKSKANLFYFTNSQTIGGNIRDLIILQLLSLQKKKCLIHLHGGYFRKLVDNDMSSLQRKLNYNVIRRLAGVIVLSKSLKSIFQGMIDDNKVFVVPNCVDDEFLISDTEIEEKMAVLNNKEVFRVLYLSNFIETKGYPEVLEMAKLEKERVIAGEKKRLHFDFAGKFFEEKDKNFFENYIRDNKLEEFVTYHGVVGGRQKKELLKQCDIFTLLTRYPKEGQPISILEAMGNGMIIVTTDHAGIPDIVEDGVNGIIIEKSSVTADICFNRLRTAVQTDRDWTLIARNNRMKIKVQMSEDKYIENIRRIYKKL